MHINYSHVTLCQVSCLFHQSITHINQSNVTSLKVTLDLTLDVMNDLTFDLTLDVTSMPYSNSKYECARNHTRARVR